MKRDRGRGYIDHGPGRARRHVALPPREMNYRSLAQVAVHKRPIYDPEVGWEGTSGLALR